jgi:hypothetical protein
MLLTLLGDPNIIFFENYPIMFAGFSVVSIFSVNYIRGNAKQKNMNVVEE